MPDGGRPKPTPRELMTLRNWILTARSRAVGSRRAASGLTLAIDEFALLSAILPLSPLARLTEGPP